MFGARAHRPGARPRPHRLPADPRRQPVRVERQPHDRARHARAGSAAIRARGGRLVVVDPRRSKTAEEADEHLFIRPGTDAHFLFGVVHTLFAEDLVDLGPARRSTSTGSTRSSGSPRRSRPRRSRRPAASTPTTIRRIARELAAAESAAVYGRIGTCTQEFGTLASWLVDVVNVLDRQPRPRGRRDVHAAPPPASATPSGKPGAGRGVRFGRWHEPGARAARGLRRAAGRRASPRRSRRRARARSAR